MRIAFDAKRAYHNVRGLGNYSRDVIRLMTTYAPQNEYRLYAEPGTRFDFPHTTTISPAGLWRLCPALWRSYGSIYDMAGVDIYHGLSGEIPYGIHRRPIQTIVTMHDAIFMRYPELYSPGYRSIFARKVQYACDHADCIIAISEQTKQDMIRFFDADERKIRVVYQGCNNRFRAPITEEQLAAVKTRYQLPERYVLFVGAMEPRKNLKALIEAMHSASINIPIVAVGTDSAYARRMQALAKERKVDLRYLFGLPFSDLPMVYRGATVFCYPSLFEGFGIPILESMCVGTPVLTSTGSCFAETGGEAALYADPLQPDQIGQQLSRIITDESLRATMTASGHAQAALFADEQVAKNLIDIYKR